MIIKNWEYSDRISNLNTTVQTGVICGVNIKPIISMDIKHGKKRADRWGLFLHIRLQNGDQYDFIWDLYHADVYSDRFGTPKYQCSYTVSPKYMKPAFPDAAGKKLRKWRRCMITEYPILPEIFKFCGVNQWVDLFNKEVTLTVVGLADNEDNYPFDMYLVRVYTESSTRTETTIEMHPQFFELHIADNSVRSFVEVVSKAKGKAIRED